MLEQDIPDWNNQLYDDIRSYAIGIGLPEEQVNNYVDPTVIKVLNKARLYDQAKQVTTTKKSGRQKGVEIKKAPANAAQMKAKRMASAKARLQERGNDIDDIADVLLQRWEQLKLRRINPMAVYTSYDQVGKAEDVSDIITDITPTDTPSSMIKSEKVNARVFEWQEDSLAAAANNAQVEGAAFSAGHLQPQP